MPNPPGEQLLEPYRVLDLSDEKGLLCGRSLADLGADVIQVEPPGGSPSRDIGPFYRDIPDRERSFFWFALCSNKKSVTLNINAHKGQEILKKLVKSADILVESYQPGKMEKLGLGYDELKNINPKLIMTSISDFGQTGPYSRHLGCDLVAMAMSGYMFVCGDPDRAPVRISFPQAYSHAGTEAAVASLIALFHQNETGKGQHVDISAQAAVARNLMNAPIWWHVNKRILQRAGAFRTGLSTSANQRAYWACKDGYVVFTLFGGVHGAATNRALVEWMDSEGMAQDFIKEIDWLAFDMASTTQEEFDRLAEPIGNFFKKHTKAELWEGGFSRGIMLYPVSTIEDIMEEPQLKARGLWQDIDHRDLKETIPYPGDWVKLSENPCKKRQRAPHIGEHNEEIYCKEMGYSQKDLTLLRGEGII